jgi:hypothetical protein
MTWRELLQEVTPARKARSRLARSMLNTLT